jgi:signal transduction histidine kinase/ligand-binding sensor domain-containing protein/DNA-binding response OmpR family regulator
MLACSGPHTAPGTPADSDDIVIADRLSNQRVNAFAEDADGHIWIGTFRGLNKYTIHDYHQYLCPDDTLGLPDNQITALHRSTDGRLWIGTANGVALRTDEGGFQRIPIEGDSPNVNEIVETRDGRLLFNCSAQLFRYDADSGRIVPIVRDYGGYTTIVGADGRIWTATMSELRCFDAANLSPAGVWPTRHPVYHIAMAATGEIWLSGMGRLSIFDPRTEKWTEPPRAILQERRLTGGDIDILFANGPDMLLHTITDGMFCYSQTTGQLLHQSNPEFPYQIPDFEIRTLFRDSRGNLWFGSTDQGYSISYAAKDGFNNLPYLTDRFAHKSVTSVCPDRDGHLWIATLNDGLFVYDLKTRDLRQIDLNRFVPDNTIGYIRCSGIFCDAQGELWLAMTEKYHVLHCRYDGKDLRVLGRVDVFNPTTISQDDLGRIWISGYSGELIRYDKDSRTVERFQLPTDQWTFVPALLQVAPGRMLVSSYGNPMCEVYTNSGEAQFLVAPDEEWRRNIRHAVMNPTCLFKDSAGDIWLGTVGNGLLHRERSTQLTRPVEGTSCPDICSIEEDRQGNIWISTMYGLTRFDRTVGSVTNYFESDGIGGNQFYDRSSCLLPDGTLIFGGTHGLTCFDPLDLGRKNVSPVVFEDLKIHNNLVHPGPDAPIDRELTRRPSVTIRHEQNGFSISYAALDYTPHSNVRYQYKMDGFDDYWIEAGTAHETYYANLPAGHYQFRVRTADATDEGQALDIRVLPPWYRSWWALVLFGLLTAGVLFFLWTVYRRIHRVRKEAARHIREVRREQERTEQEKAAEKRLNRVQMNYFANVAHEFRTPLTMIAGPVEQLAASPGIQGQDRQLVGIVQRNAAWMLSLVGQLLDFNRIGDKKLQLKVAEGDVVATLRESADMFRFNAESKGIEFNTHGLEDTFTMWRDADKVAKITMNLLSNAMKFTQPGGKVALSFDVLPREEVARDFPLTDADTDTQYAQIRVSDTGRGIPEDQLEKIFERFHQAGRGDAAGTGIGLYYSRALAELHHGYIHARNRDGGGAEFTFILPVNAAAYSEDERTAEEPQRLTIPLPDAAPERPAEDEGADKRRIVVVDDDIDVANYVKVLLSPYYQVIVHFDADSALKALEEEAPDLVVSDVVMPGKSGYELCEAIKGNLQLSHIPVILVTAKVAVESQVQGLDKGADAYVTKPFNPSYLLALVKSLLENRDKLRRQLGSVTSTEEIAPEALSPRDNAFMKELYELMDNELANQELDINRITEMMRISRTKFYYKVKGLTGENPGVFFKRYKLNRAADLLKEGKHNMSEIAWMTGFNTLSHFSTSFKKQFGVPPSEYTG